MKKQVAWSHSALNSFETCPLRYYKTRVSKEVVEPQTEVLRYGNGVHKAFELRLKDGTALPEYLQCHEPLVKSLMQKKGERLVEKQWAIDKSFRPVGWFDKNVWCRGVVDVGIVHRDTAVLLDWKTGKRKPDNDQLKLFAGLTFAHYRSVKTVTTGFVWLAANKIDNESFTRDQAGEVWSSFLPRVQRLEIAYEENKWQAKPSGLCANYCPVPRAHCEFSGTR
jgi:hypothetical protein